MSGMLRCLAAFVLVCLAWAQQPENTASIDGAVVNDATGEPVPRAEVTLGGAAAQQNAASDSSGHFTFSGLAAGTYWMNAQRAGYTPAGQGSRIVLAAAEHKSGVELRMVQQGAISGRVADEFGVPLWSCQVSVMQSVFERGRNRLSVRNSAQTNDKGEYRISGLNPGRYYVGLRCGQTLIAPHPLLPLNDPRIPMLVAPFELYPGVPDATSATPVTVAAGARVTGIDFAAGYTPAFTVRGRVTNPAQNTQVTLFADRADAPEWVLSGGVDPAKGTFRIDGAPAGVYTLVAGTMGGGRVFQARMPIQVGSAPPDPVTLTLDPVPDLSGTLEIEGDNPQPLEAIQVFLSPLDVLMSWQQPQAKVDRDGRFTLPSVAPGRWQLNMLQAQGYVKSFQIGPRNASPYAFDLAPGEAGPLKIVVSMRMARIKITAAGGFSALLVPTDPAKFPGLRVVPGNGSVLTDLAPGRYRVFALESAQDAWTLAQKPEALKALEPLAQTVDLVEGQTDEITATPIPSSETRDSIR
jgi:hypothetical protein